MKETIEFNGLYYPVVDADNLRFSTVSLLDALYDVDGNPISDRAKEIDESIAYYFEDSTFYSKSINQLTNLFYEIRNYQNH